MTGTEPPADDPPSSGVGPAETPDGYHMCPGCGHHTSAYAGGCTVFVPLDDQDGMPFRYCGCDCRKVITGKSLIDVVAEALWGKDSGS